MSVLCQGKSKNGSHHCPTIFRLRAATNDTDVLPGLYYLHELPINYYKKLGVTKVKSALRHGNAVYTQPKR